MADIANITIIGRLTRNPETTETTNSSVTKFSIAVNGYTKEQVSFFDCEAWGKTGEIIQKYCEKGKQLAIAGAMRIDRWEDAEGNKRSKPIVNVREMMFLGSKDDSKSIQSKGETVGVSQDDIPF